MAAANVAAVANSVNAANILGTTRLMAAARDGNIAEVNRLIAAGADVNKQNAGGSTAMILTIWSNKIDNTTRIPIVNTLIAAGADINIRNKLNKSPLMIAIEKRNPEIADILMNAGANSRGVRIIRWANETGKNLVTYKLFSKNAPPSNVAAVTGVKRGRNTNVVSGSPLKRSKTMSANNANRSNNTSTVGGRRRKTHRRRS